MCIRDSWYTCLGCLISSIVIIAHSLHAWYFCVLTFVFNQESYSSASTLSLEESWGESSEPFTGNSFSLFSYTLCDSLVCIISFHSTLFDIRLAHHLFTPSRWFTISIRAWYSWFGSNNLELKILFFLITIFAYTHINFLASPILDILNFQN